MPFGNSIFSLIQAKNLTNMAKLSYYYNKYKNGYY
jgi:hypothetical protein